ncbi:MAG: hypothetical protein JWR09_2488 [Mucilaginibacter sp.]|nr:hypothetical protein [Mucilaginibacter sp.]
MCQSSFNSFDTSFSYFKIKAIDRKFTIPAGIYCVFFNFCKRLNSLILAKDIL